MPTLFGEQIGGVAPSAGSVARADRHEPALRQRVLSGIDLVIEFVTLGEYGLEPFFADASPRQGTDRRCPVEPPEPVDFREAIRRFAA